MAIVTTDDKNYKAIAAAIRKQTSETRQFKPSEMAEGVDLVATISYGNGERIGYRDGYEIGYQEGMTAGYGEGEKDGKQAEYDAFWNRYQNYGNRSNYSYAFAGKGWGDESFNPKYPIKVVGSANTMFRESVIQKRIDVDFSEATNLQYGFYDTKTVEVGVVDISSIDRTGLVTYLFNVATNLHTIEKLILGTMTGTFTNVFNSCVTLQNIVIEGKIRNNGLNFQWSPLTHASLMSIVNALEDYSADASGTVWTITLGADNVAKLSAEELQMIREKGWVYG